MLISALIIVAFTGLAVNRELSNEWHQHQSQYKEFLVKNAKSDIDRKRAAGIETGAIRQIFLPSSSTGDDQHLVGTRLFVLPGHGGQE